MEKTLCLYNEYFERFLLSHFKTHFSRKSGMQPIVHILQAKSEKNVTKNQSICINKKRANFAATKGVARYLLAVACAYL